MSPLLLIILLHLTIIPSTFALEFLFNSFNATTDVILINDSRLESSVIRLTTESNPLSIGRLFHRSQIMMKPTSNSTTISSFSTSFVFSVLPEISSSPGFGLVFVLSNSTEPAGALTGQYFGAFSTANVVGPLLAVEFDTGRNQEFNDPDGNHIGIDLNRIISADTAPGGYFNSNGGDFIPLDMRNGQNIHSWIEFDGTQFEINVTIAPAGMARPARPSLTFRDPIIANYLSTDMYVGFSASQTTWIEAQRVLAWSFSDTGIAPDISTTNLPVFRPPKSNSLSPGAIAGITIGCVLFSILCLGLGYWFWRKHNLNELEDDEIEDWELEYWPHRFTFEELTQATNGFSDSDLLGRGGFGRVYKGTLPNNTEVAVKCVSHDSKQGLREFMAEISSMGRLQHKNLVQMRGWCRKGNELMIVYDYMPNGSLNSWIFDKPKKVMCWDDRRKVMADVAEGLNYLHHGWDQVVIHRDIKSSNILLDSNMRGRLGDFGLAKLYTHGEVPNTTRVVGTLGYLAPELATVAAPTAASDVYSFGVVVLEVVCGRRPIETWAETEEEAVLIDWVRGKYMEGRLWEAADRRVEGEYEVAEMEAVLKLGLACCHPDPNHRPTMREVVVILLGEEAAAMVPRILVAELGPSGSETSGVAEAGETAAQGGV